MGLKFYVGEVQGQINDAIRTKNEGQQAIEQLQSSISQFLSAPLSGKAYTSAKNYFQVAYTPLCRAAIMSGEALVSAHRKLLSEYQSTVGSIDTDEDQLREHIANLKEIQRDLERQINNAKTMRPDLERRYINAGEAINKVQERIDKLIAYDIASANFFADYHTCQSQYRSGLAQVQNSKAWNSASGTFDLGLLDMSWAADVNKRWDERAQAQEQERLDKFNKGMEGRSYCHVQIATGAYKWMWVKDPLKVTQEDLKFNEEYKEYLYILLHPQENGIMDDYFATMAEELRTGKNSKTGELLNDVEKAQRWSVVLSAISVAVIGAYYGSKNYSDSNVKAPKNSVIKGEKNGKTYTIDKNKSKGNSSYIKTPKIPTKNLDSLPKNVSEAFNKYTSNDWRGNVAGQSEGTKAGKSYKNRDSKLPTVNSKGDNITYKEYDVNDKIPNMNRDAERLVRGSDGNIYYTNDHYGSFIKIE